MIRLLRQLPILFLLLLCSCSSMLYYPDRPELVDRAKLPLKPQDIYFNSANGAKLHGWYFESTVAHKRSCVLLFFHGNAQNLSSHFLNLYSAPEQGYDYFIFDYQGYGESEGHPTPRHTVEDGEAAMRWLASKQSRKSIVVFGQSLGGIVALKTVLNLKNEITPKAVFADSTFSSYRSAGRAVLNQSWLTWLFQPFGWFLLSDEMAPKGHVAELSPIPLIVIHGTNDRAIPEQLGKSLYAEAAEPKEFWEISNGRHTDFMFRDRRQYADKFFDKLDSFCD